MDMIRKLLMQDVKPVPNRGEVLEQVRLFLDSCGPDDIVDIEMSTTYEGTNR